MGGEGAEVGGGRAEWTGDVADGEVDGAAAGGRGSVPAGHGRTDPDSK